MIVGLRHAVYVGWILGIARANGVPLEADVDPLGNYTDRLMLDVAVNPGDPADMVAITLTIVVPPPPDDWVLPWQ